MSKKKKNHVTGGGLMSLLLKMLSKSYSPIIITIVFMKERALPVNAKLAYEKLEQFS